MSQIIHNYHPVTKEYLSSNEARLDPLESTEKKPIYIIPAHATQVAPPATITDGKVAMFNETTKKWSQAEDHRGKVYDTATGAESLHSELGVLSATLTATAPTSNSTWDATASSGKGAWVFDSAQSVAAQKALIGQSYSDGVQAIVGGYPQSEIDTWPKQEAEARALVADNTAATPFLSSLATSRGTTVDVVAGKVVANADAYITAIAALLGKRQKLDAQLDLLAADPATVQSEIDGITW